MPDKLLTLKEAQARLMVSKDTLRRWRQSGRIKVVKTGTRLIRIPESEITRIIESATVETKDDEDWDGN